MPKRLRATVKRFADDERVCVPMRVEEGAEQIVRLPAPSRVVMTVRDQGDAHLRYEFDDEINDGLSHTEWYQSEAEARAITRECHDIEDDDWIIIDAA